MIFLGVILNINIVRDVGWNGRAKWSGIRVPALDQPEHLSLPLIYVFRFQEN